MCSKVNWFVEYKLLFDLNYKFELIGASLLALAKSIYYENTESYLCVFPSSVHYAVRGSYPYIEQNL